MKLYLQHLNKADLPATDAILRKVLDVELKEKPANKPNARIYAGYEAGTYYVKCQEDRLGAGRDSPRGQGCREEQAMVRRRVQQHKQGDTSKPAERHKGNAHQQGRHSQSHKIQTINPGVSPGNKHR